jgi:hypothetical protein
MEDCARALSERLAEREKARSERQAERDVKQAALASRRQALEDNPFDPRTEVSADARHIAGRIVKHLWILFVLLPIVAVILLALLGAIK